MSFNSKFREVKGNLFTSTESIAHCVSSDLEMGKGIATSFKNIFGGVEQLHTQPHNIGDSPFLTRDNRYIYYLVTKNNYWHKPTYNSLRMALQNCATHCRQHGVKNISIPKIGCGLDRLDWSEVKIIINDIMCDAGITVTVYHI